MLVAVAAAFAASLLFSVTVQVPRQTLLACGLCGATSWLLAMLATLQRPVTGSFVGALAVGLLSEFLARHQRQPASVYVYAGILPLVPGVNAFHAVMALVGGDTTTGLLQLVQSLVIAGAIAAGVAIATTLARRRSRWRQSRRAAR